MFLKQRHVSPPSAEHLLGPSCTWIYIIMTVWITQCYYFYSILLVLRIEYSLSRFCRELEMLLFSLSFMNRLKPALVDDTSFMVVDISAKWFQNPSTNVMERTLENNHHFWHVISVTLTLEEWISFLHITHCLMEINISVK